MKPPLITGLIGFCLMVLLTAAGPAESSWLIEQREFHISAHGQFSCRDCHEAVFTEAMHPDPREVNKSAVDFSPEDQCLICHDSVEADLEAGRHGSRLVYVPADYRICVDCHDPHSQPRLGENRIARFAPGIPRTQQCGACHEFRSHLPPLPPEDEACMTCHRFVDPESPDGIGHQARLCFHCHGPGTAPARELTGRLAAMIDPEDYAATAHGHISCTQCHPEAPQYDHGEQPLTTCRQCHVPHDEGVNHHAHLNVACGACHLDGVRLLRAPETQAVSWVREGEPGKHSAIHRMSPPAEDNCRRCHFPGNDLGAASMVLPPKSILCMPCHAGTLTAGDTTTLLSLLVFFAGMAILFTYWLSGSVAEGDDEAGPGKKTALLLRKGLQRLFSRRALAMAKAAVLGVLLQNRLFRMSRTRWFIHSLIFWPFVFRFIWGAIALSGSLWFSQWDPVWDMLNQNHPLTAFLFDLTGIMIILGVILALVRGAVSNPERPAKLPAQDRPALGLIAAIVGVGFVLEGMRISMTGFPPGSQYAFLGYRIATLLSNGDLTGSYGYFWYAHAVLTGMFIAYLPFSRLIHIIAAPLALVMDAAGKRK